MAPAGWRAIDFLSDLHLSSQTPRTFEALARHLAHTPADAVFILGDLFEAWVGDDARHEGFEADCTAMLREAAARRPIAFMHGNRDFLIGADFLQSCGLRPLADPTLLRAFGQRLLLTHGDLLCTGDVDYQRYRSQVRTPQWQAAFLARPSNERRIAVSQMREQSRQHQAQQAAAAQDFFDVDAGSAAAWLRAAGASILLHGHTHRPATHAIAPGLVRHVLSDWDFDASGVARGDVLRWRADGLSRVAPSHAAA